MFRALQLNLSENMLCGVNPYDGEGTYTAEGITVLADALKVTGSVTKLNLCDNNLGAEDEAVLHKAVEGRSGFKLEL